MERARYSPIGWICLTGSYCPLGSSLPILCPVGTFNNHTEASSISDCTNCTPGYFCEGLGNSQPSGACEEGYYCLLGSTTASPVQITHDIVSGNYFGGNICPTDHYCAAGMLVVVHLEPIIMLLVKVTVSFVLQATFVLLKRLILYDCPIGYYGSNGTEYATQFPCPS